VPRLARAQCSWAGTITNGSSVRPAWGSQHNPYLIGAASAFTTTNDRSVDHQSSTKCGHKQSSPGNHDHWLPIGSSRPLPVTEADKIAAAKRPFRRQRARAPSRIRPSCPRMDENITQVLIRVGDYAEPDLLRVFRQGSRRCLAPGVVVRRSVRGSAWQLELSFAMLSPELMGGRPPRPADPSRRFWSSR